jgi:4,5-DOPA dioxygenase extradiol
MPLLFLGHGSPMNAIENNSYTQMLAGLSSTIEKPKAILVVSAHWATEGIFVTAKKQPKTIHDFAGFPDELFAVQYPAPGDVELANRISEKVTNPKIHKDAFDWGLDHGTWSVLRHIYPKADIPVLQLSLDLSQSAEFHFEMGRSIEFLRQEGVLIVGSGNIVHNLRKISWISSAAPFDWAVEFDDWAKARLVAKDFTSLVIEPLQSKAGQLSVPTWEHYLPLLSILGAAETNESLNFIFEGFQNASISMRSFRIG